MDKVVPTNRRRQFFIAALLIGLGVACVFAVWHALPQGLQVAAADVRIAAVERGTFLDQIVVRANASPLHAVILDAVESGRVEEVFARDGALVEKEAPLFRLSNPQRQLDLLARQSDQATQISNLSNLRVGLEVSITDHERRLADLEFNVAQAEKQDARNRQLASQGFISNAALEESADKLAQQRHVLADERLRSGNEIAIKRNGLAQMEQAIARLDSGLALMNASIAALTVRAPAAGRLTDFHLQVGEGVTQNQHIGRIDDPVHFKLGADVDEYYLSRATVGRQGKAQSGEQGYPVEISRVYPQIDKGQFKVEMLFSKTQPPVLNPGQSLDTEIMLGDPVPALLLPAGEFINDSGGAWVFVLSADGSSAERRAIHLGRRSSSQVEVTAGLRAGEKVIVSGYAGFGHATHLQLIR